MSDLDLLLINPSDRGAIYQELGDSLTAVEPPLWCRLIAGYARDRGFSVQIIDAEAAGWSPEAVAGHVAAAKPKLVGMVVFDHREGASYGFCLTAPSWVLQLAEQRSARILGYQEAAWSDHQDVLVLQQTPLDGPYRG